ncbi:MAG: helix-turn-helix transcriptional regulator [Alistipes sp.]|nr:helix-turn-helix transcriptional regulator [Alistipes sp.]
MIALRIEEILRERGITKTQFAEMMGVAKQNVNLLLNTNNTQKLEKIAEVLGMEFTDLFVLNNKPQEELNGFIEYKGEVYRIRTKTDLIELLNIID